MACRKCGCDDRIYETGVADYGWSCNVVRGSGGLETEDSGRNVEYFDHRATLWRCGECDHQAATLDELVRGTQLSVGSRVVLPHGTVGEIEAILGDERKSQPR